MFLVDWEVFLNLAEREVYEVGSNFSHDLVMSNSMAILHGDLSSPVNKFAYELSMLGTGMVKRPGYDS